MVMEVTEDPQIEVSLKMSHLIQHISKLGHMVEKQKSYSQNKSKQCSQVLYYRPLNLTFLNTK